MRCYLVNLGDANHITAGVAARDDKELPPGDVTIRVTFSSLNYKDALAASGHRGVVRAFPHVPGVDAAGLVEASTSRDVTPGQEVLVTGYQLGAERWGGWAEKIRVPADWVIPLPQGMTAREAMIYGTAGFTAAQGVDLLLRHGITPESGEIAVTGATGGVGCLAVAVLAKLGYRVVAFSGKAAQRTWLERLGAQEVLGRDALADGGEKPLLAARWAGAIDTIGGAPLAHLIRGAQRGACLTCCGMLAGVELPINVFPFILRGVTLAGIDSAECPRAKRIELWQQLAGPWRPAELDSLAEEVSLEDVGDEVARILRGEVVGRTIVRVADD